MGCAAARDKELKVAFDPHEQKKLKHSFNHLLHHSQNKNTLTQSAFEHHFPENRAFAGKLYRWMLQNAASDASEVTLEVFLASLELLLKEQLDYYLVQYHFRTFEKVEIMALISLDSRELDRDLFERLSITYSQALVFIKEILGVFFTDKPLNLDDIAVKVLVTGIFGPNASMDYLSFISALKAQLPFVNKVIKQYFQSKFLDKDLKLKLPELNSASHILNDQMLGLFYLSHGSFQSIDKLTLIYSTASSKTDFETLSRSLLNYESPTLILIKHLERFDQDEARTSDSHYIFGGFCSTPWRNQPSSTGDASSYVFSLLPRFRNYFTPLGEGGRAYAYISTENRPNSQKGIGFGGDNYKSFRIWLDEDLYGKSYVNAEDRTFEKGYLLDHYITKLKIQHIEVWGLGSEHYIQSQDVLRQTEIAHVESLRQKDYDGRKSELVYSSSKQTVGGPVKDLAASDFRATYSYAQRSEKTKQSGGIPVSDLNKLQFSGEQRSFVSQSYTTPNPFISPNYNPSQDLNLRSSNQNFQVFDYKKQGVSSEEEEMRRIREKYNLGSNTGELGRVASERVVVERRIID